MLKFLLKKISECAQDTKAIVIPTFAIMVFTAVTIVLTAFDINSYMSTRAALQSLADQSTLSSLSTDDTSITEAARQDLCRKIFSKGVETNPKILVKDKIIPSANVVCNFDPISMTMTLTARVTIKPALSGMTGVTTNTVITATSAMNRNSLEIVMAVSTAGTMCMNMNNTASTTGGYLHLKPELSGSYTGQFGTVNVGLDSNNCSKLAAVKTGIGNLLHYVEVLNDVQVGFVPYHHKVVFPNNALIPSSLGGNGGEPVKPIHALTKETNAFFNSDNFTREEQVSKITPFFDLRNYLTSAGANGILLKYIELINDGFVSAPHITPWTRTDLPMHVATLMLDPGHTNYFGNHTVKNWGTADHQKIVILMTDGVNIGCCYTQNEANGGGGFNNQYIYHYERYTQNTAAICAALKTAGVIIYTIMVDLPPPTSTGFGTGVTAIRNMMTNCATDTGKSYSVNFLQDPNSVAKVFADIGEDIVSLKIVE